MAERSATTERSDQSSRQSMKRLLFCFSLMCGLSSVACNRAGPPPPPATTYRVTSAEVVIEGTTHKSYAGYVTRQFFLALPPQPGIGRYFADEEYQSKSGDSATSEGVAVLSHEFWRQRFGSNPAIVGESLEVNGKRHRVVGVTPRDFHAPERAEILLPDVASNR
jgi:hypothetical protein